MGFRQTGYSELVSKIKFQLLEIQSKNKESTVNITSSYLCFENIVTSFTLNSRDEIQELYEDVWVKTNEFGETLRILIPRPPLGIEVNEVFGMGYMAKFLLSLFHLRLPRL